MPEEQLFKTEATQTRREIADTLVAVAEEIKSGTVTLGGMDEPVEASIPADPTFEVELERLTDSETGEERYELEYEIRWRRTPTTSTETEAE
ncbi:amphi-Trp domain-containing protein [Halobellus captivus]|uniref:amphi-Trp domain-containing protein n=1 Tax=Halobellus captivus TaxID=2592614 RepID=UPI0011A633B8|nr:amphi-Trp domain-containing protein [Halobellus captivus]